MPGPRLFIDFDGARDTVARISIRFLASRALLLSPLPLPLLSSFPAVYALRRYNRRLFLVLRETSISNFVGASRSKLLRPLKRPPLREKSSVYFFYDRLMPRAGGAASKEEKMRPITRSERGAVLGTEAAVCRAIINSGKSISSKRLLPKPRL